MKQHMKYVETYSAEENYQSLTYEDTLLIREEVAPLILPERDAVTAIAKLITNRPLTETDVESLQQILWRKVDFTDLMVWFGIKRVIDTINVNAVA